MKHQKQIEQISNAATSSTIRFLFKVIRFFFFFIVNFTQFCA